MKLYNTYSKKIEEFTPIRETAVHMYSCGPTVYGYQHIGNYASVLFSDFLHRALLFSGYNVNLVMNITDVGHLTSDADEGEDKIIKKAQEEGKTPEEIARFFEKSFMDDLKKINIKPAKEYPRATDHIKEMIAMIETLIKNGNAYESNGNVYFDIESFDKYGMLSGNTLENLKKNVREEVKEDSNKKNPHDFVLWFKAPENHLMKWESPWSIGYPGWHIECSAMAERHLGNHIDIHTGGEDNIFPHHECEIAQSEAAHKTPFANFWIHRRHILVDGEKMSKSKGTTYTITNLEEKNYHPLVFRLFIFGTHYRSQTQFSFENLDAAKSGLDRIVSCVNRLEKIDNTEGTNLEAAAIIDEANQKFKESIQNDLNTPEALAAIHTLISKTNTFIDQRKINKEEASEIVAALKKYDELIGCIFSYKESQKELPIPLEIEQLSKERLQARNEKDFDKADEIRNKIEALGYTVKDTENGIEIGKK